MGLARKQAKGPNFGPGKLRRLVFNFGFKKGLVILCHSSEYKIACFLSPFLDVTRLSFSAISFSAQLTLELFAYRMLSFDLRCRCFFFFCWYLFPFFLFPLGFPICFSSLFSSLFCNSISSNGFSALFELNLSENKRKEKSTFALPAQSFYLPISMVERFINA